MSDTPVVDILEEEQGYGLVDGPHIEIAFEALNDTLEQEVTGVESLTQAQQYMHGVLGASGALTRAEINGSEGFFSKIGDGLRKTWEYIKKMFKNIWGFFFKKKAPEQAKAAKAELEKSKDALEMKAPEVKKQLVAAANASGDADAKKAAEEADDIAGYRAAAMKLAKVKGKARNVLATKASNLLEVLKGGASLVESIKKSAADAKHPEYKTFCTSVESDARAAAVLMKAVEGMKDIETLDAAKSSVEKMLGYVATLEKSIASISTLESRIQHIIDEVEKDMGKVDDAGKAAAQEAVKSLRGLMADSGKYSTLLQHVLDYLPQLNRALLKVFGINPPGKALMVV